MGGERDREREQIFVCDTDRERRMPKTILICEDNEVNLKLFREITDALGHRTLVAKDGGKGVLLAKEYIPDLILMDIQMPVMAGSEAFRILSADPATKDIPVIALTSYAMRGDKEKYLNEGFVAYISKPINVKEFMNTIKAILDKAGGNV
ncbi:MAG: response regulator [Thermodesulfovibrionales bacterium]